MKSHQTHALKKVLFWSTFLNKHVLNGFCERQRREREKFGNFDATFVENSTKIPFICPKNWLLSFEFKFEFITQSIFFQYNFWIYNADDLSKIGRFQYNFWIYKSIPPPSPLNKNTIIGWDLKSNQVRVVRVVVLTIKFWLFGDSEKVKNITCPHTKRVM